jgi:CRISPR-associated endonuclease/helicase Cas3
VDALVLWAKWRKGEPGSYHPLLCHLCDVAAVTIELWESVLSPWTRAAMATDLGPGEEAAGHWIAYLSGLHDIGKASPAFQLKVEAARPRLENAGLPVNAKPGDIPHGTVSTAVLGRLLAERHRFDPALIVPTRVGVNRAIRLLDGPEVLLLPDVENPLHPHGFRAYYRQ